MEQCGGTVEQSWCNVVEQWNSGTVMLVKQWNIDGGTVEQ